MVASSTLERYGIIIVKQCCKQQVTPSNLFQYKPNIIRNMETFTVFISIRNTERQTDKLVLRKFFLNEKDAKKYYCNLQKTIVEKGYIYFYSNHFHHIYAGTSTTHAAYYDGNFENDLDLTLERQSCNIFVDEEYDRIVLYCDCWDGGKIHVFEGIEDGKKAIFEDGELTFDNFTAA